MSGADPVAMASTGPGADINVPATTATTCKRVWLVRVGVSTGNHVTWHAMTLVAAQAPQVRATHQLPTNHSGNVSIMVVDDYGRNATNNQLVQLLINPTPAPSAAIGNGAPVNLTAGDSMGFNSNASTCPTGNCTTMWSLACPPNRGGFDNRTSNHITVTTGGVRGVDVNTTGLRIPTDTIACELGGWAHGLPA